MNDDRDSRALFERALRVTPGGVHSPVRAFKGVGGTPVFVQSASGAQLADVEGRRYTDYCMAFGPLILGHAPPAVREAVERALARGWSYGAAEPYSLELAEFIATRIPWVEQLRFVNSGTEAVMTALRIARGATGRSRVVKFDGCYHGHLDTMLVKAGSGLAGTSSADSAGLAPDAIAQTLVAPLDDEAALEALFTRHGSEIAAVIVEPLPANYGLLPQRPEFIARMAELARHHGALVIFDEVITGFRLAFGGYSEWSPVKPDLVTYGKIIGGGFPVGAVGGRRDLLSLLAPVGPVYQAGTLAANPVAMAAGLATLSALADGRIHRQLEELGLLLEQCLQHGDTPWRVQRAGSIFWLHRPRTSGVLRSPAALPPGTAADYATLFHALLREGIYLAPGAFEVGFLSTAHTPADVERLAAAVIAASANG